MGGGLAFLTKKSFNPANISNQKNVWEAKQRKDIEAAKNKERQIQLQRERDHEELERARGGDGQGDRAALRFMYEVPPGLESRKDEQDHDDNDDVMNHKKSSTDESKDNSGGVIGANFLHRQDGDDEAAAMFRQIFSASAADTLSDNHQEEDKIATDEYGTSVVLSGSTLEVDQTNNKNGVDSRTQLEKAAGIRNRFGNTLEEQVARFPQLKNAPMAKGLKTDEVNVKFNPLGAQIRNVRCLKCGVWGHSRGDRECKLSGWNPFENYGSNTIKFNKTSTEIITNSQHQDKLIGTNNDTSRNTNNENRLLSESEKYNSNSSDDDGDDDSRRKKHSRKKHRKRRREERKHRKKRKKKSKRKYHSSLDDDSISSDDSYHKKRKKSHKRQIDDKRRRRRDSHSIES